MNTNYKEAWIEYFRSIVEGLEAGTIDLMKASADFEICDESTASRQEIVRNGVETLSLKLYRRHDDRRGT